MRKLIMGIAHFQERLLPQYAGCKYGFGA